MKEGRDEKGQFIKGGPPGPGRPPRRGQRELLRQLLAQCTPERLDAVFMRLIADATAGRPEAMKLLLGHVLGKPSAPAPTTTQLVVEEEAGVDPLAFDIEIRRDQSE